MLIYILRLLRDLLVYKKHIEKFYGQRIRYVNYFIAAKWGFSSPTMMPPIQPIASLEFNPNTAGPSDCLSI